MQVSIQIKGVQQTSHGQREVSWTLTKKFDSHLPGPGEIKRDPQVVLDPQESPGKIKSREVELGSEM